jgi:hypothetical protein
LMFIGHSGQKPCSSAVLGFWRNQRASVPGCTWSWKIGIACYMFDVISQSINEIQKQKQKKNQELRSRRPRGERERERTGEMWRLVTSLSALVSTSKSTLNQVNNYSLTHHLSVEKYI